MDEEFQPDIITIAVDGANVAVARHPVYDFCAAAEDGTVYNRPAASRLGVPRGGPLPRSEWWQRIHTFPVYAPYTPPYLRFRIVSGKVSKMPTVHRFVCECYYGVRPPHILARHLDDDHTNNALGNLRYGTRMDNTRDAFRNGGNYAAGTRNANAKLTVEDVVAIRQADADGVSRKDICARWPQVHPNSIRNAIQRQTWSHVP